MAFPRNFQPEQGESVSKYTLANLESGSAVKIRLLTDLVIGYSVWGEDREGKRKCTRVKPGTPMPTAAIGTNKFTGRPEKVKQFIAGVVWNYATEQLEILETDKSTIIDQLYALEQTDEYGDLKLYDIKIGKAGEKMDTVYSVIALPPKPVDKQVAAKLADNPINLEALFTNDDPFKASGEAEAASDNVADDVPF